MRRLYFYLTLALLLVSRAAFAVGGGETDWLKTLRNVFSESAYSGSFEVRSGESSLGSGSAVVSSRGYQVITPIIEFWSDGQTGWTVDRVIEEVYVEPSPWTLDSLLASFTQQPIARAVFEGLDVFAYTLTCTDDDFGLESLTLYSDARTKAVKGALARMSSGAEFTFVLSSSELIPLGSFEESFAFDTASLSDDYVVTDLR